MFPGVISYTEYLFLLCILTSKYLGEGENKNPFLEIFKLWIYRFTLEYYFLFSSAYPSMEKIMYLCLFEPLLYYRNPVLCFKSFIL